MLGLLIQLALSWLIVWFYGRKNLSVLGLRPTRTRVVYLGIFFGVTGLACALGFILKMYFGNQVWRLNPELSPQIMLSGIWWNIKSVLFEELIFRGVLLYILLRTLGRLKAILVSASAFGIYHWFSFGVIGNPMAMATTFFITGIMGLVLAYAYAKTFSLYLPVGIHLGWNLTQIFIFSSGPIGHGVFITEQADSFRTNSYLIFFLVTFLPVVLALSTNYLLIRRIHSWATPA